MSNHVAVPAADIALGDLLLDGSPRAISHAGRNSERLCPTNVIEREASRMFFVAAVAATFPHLVAIENSQPMLSFLSLSFSLVCVMSFSTSVAPTT